MAKRKPSVDENANTQESVPVPDAREAAQSARFDQLFVEIEKLGKSLLQARHHPVFDKTPDFIDGQMRDYQIDGLNWLISLHRHKTNGVLGDEMGLGKTLQAISLMSYVRSRNIGGPFLVIAPKSTISNWMNEVRRFSKNLTAVALTGGQEERSRTKQALRNPSVDWDICIVNYEVILSEESFLKKFEWQYIVVDEGHRMKNEKNRFSQTLRRFKSNNRLLLTGTPLQNTLHELWALFNYLLPQMFGNADDFDYWFDSDDCLAGNNEIVERLQTILKTLMLRRIKADVEKSLLPKLEVKLFVGLTALQREVYCKVLRKEVFQTNGMGERSLKRIDHIQMELRKAANHPYLIDNIEPEPFTNDEHLFKCCGKMLLLDKLLTKLKGQGSRVLIFSQFVLMLNILDDYLNWRGHNYRRLDGNTTYEQRAVDIDAFNAPNSDIFIYLISTRAGGLGINLATADSVIIYDSDWNPQMDAQAIDRVHRIGQTKQVRVFRLVTENTIDERIVQRAEIKLRLDQMIIASGRAPTNKPELANQREKMLIAHFGAEHILSDKCEEIIDVDVEQILRDGTIKTNAENAKYAKMKEHELRKYTLEEASATSLYKFEGVDYRQLTSAPQEAVSDLRTRRANVNSEPPLGLAKLIDLHDFQFFPPELYLQCIPGTFKLNMSTHTDNKEALLEQGFPRWKKVQYERFCEALIKYGAADVESIAQKMGNKTPDEVARYIKTFFERGRLELANFKNIEQRLKRADHWRVMRCNRVAALKWKCAGYSDPAKELVIEGPREEFHPSDATLLRMLLEIGVYTKDALQKVQHRLQELAIREKLYLPKTYAYIQSRIDQLMDLFVAEYAKHRPIASPSSSKAPKRPYHVANFNMGHVNAQQNDAVIATASNWPSPAKVPKLAHQNANVNSSGMNAQMDGAVIVCDSPPPVKVPDPVHQLANANSSGKNAHNIDEVVVID